MKFWKIIEIILKSFELMMRKLQKFLRKIVVKYLSKTYKNFE